MGPRRRRAVAAALVAAVLVTGSANAERAQHGNLIVTLDGGISPRKLPRGKPVPVAVHLSGGVQTTDESPLPRVNKLKLELAWRGILSTRGLPVCPRGRLVGRDNRQAVGACGRSLVGRGNLHAKIFLPGQAPFGVKTILNAFNGKTKVGRPAVLVHAYTPDPPVSFLIPFVIKRQPGAFRTVLVSTLKRSVGTWPHVANFRVSVSRSFELDGVRRSYLKASCPVPKNFTAGFLSFARATYTFANGDELPIESVRSCRAR